MYQDKLDKERHVNDTTADYRKKRRFERYIRFYLARSCGKIQLSKRWYYANWPDESGVRDDDCSSETN